MGLVSGFRGLIQFLPFLSSQGVCRNVLAHLQCTDVGNNGPAIFDRDPLPERRHPADPVGNRQEQLSVRKLHQAFDMIVRRSGKAALDDQTVTGPAGAMAMLTEGIETILSACEERFRYRNRNSGNHFAVVKTGLFRSLIEIPTPGDCSRNRCSIRDGGELEMRRFHCVNAWLVRHFLPAAGNAEGDKEH